MIKLSYKLKPSHPQDRGNNEREFDTEAALQTFLDANERTIVVVYIEREGKAAASRLNSLFGCSKNEAGFVCLLPSLYVLLMSVAAWGFVFALHAVAVGGR